MQQAVSLLELHESRNRLYLPSAWPSAAQVEATTGSELLSRLKRLEGVIEHLSEKNVGAPNAPSPPQQAQPQQDEPARADPPHSADNENCPFVNLDPRNPPKKRNLEHEFGRLVIEEGRSRYVSNRLWASLGDEVGSLRSYQANIVCCLDRLARAHILLGGRIAGHSRSVVF